MRKYKQEEWFDEKNYLFNPARANLIRSGNQVTIEYVKDGGNIATKLTSDGDEKEPYGN